MRKKKKRSQSPGSSGFDQLPANTDFYAGAPSEQPLYQEQRETDAGRVRKTARHQAVAGRREETVDPREKMALIAILRAVITILALLIAFFMLWKGIKIYEESVWMEKQGVPEVAPVMQDVLLTDDLDINADDPAISFESRVETWKETERLVRSVGDLLLRDNINQAIKRCNQALKLDPAHIGALKYLGQLYFEQEMYLEAVNTYIRLVSVDPSRGEFQLALMKALDAYNDPEATVHVAKWYQEQHAYDADVQRYIANAYYRIENYTEAVAALERVLKDTPRDVEMLEKLAVSYMHLEDYENALSALERQVAISYRDPLCYRRMAICNAQLGNTAQVVQIFGKSAHLFGADTVGMWIQDPLMDPIRLDHEFKLFADSVMTEEYRKYLEQMARSMEQKSDERILPQLEMSETEAIDAELLKPRQQTGQ